ncbi:MAG: 50S ribosome-binding GTPase, partial [Phycisphaerales bacterium]|nr:50S ribosome-binding GTPase [Phycisphaerales bacterium]
MNERTLTVACERLTARLGIEAPDLSLGAERALADRLWIWGVLGGKEVGKSTLINAIAGASVVDSGNDGGEGTRHATAFAHPDDADAVRARLREVEVVATSTTERLALVDLPDFDSNFRDHAALVHAISPALDGIIWVTTPKKIADVRAVEEVRRLLQSRTNFLYVVNKGDWLLERTKRVESLDRLRSQLEQQARASGEDDPTELAFIISARGVEVGGDLAPGD